MFLSRPAKKSMVPYILRFCKGKEKEIIFMSYKACGGLKQPTMKNIPFPALKLSVSQFTKIDKRFSPLNFQRKPLSLCNVVRNLHISMQNFARKM